MKKIGRYMNASTLVVAFMPVLLISFQNCADKAYSNDGISYKDINIEEYERLETNPYLNTIVNSWTSPRAY